MCACQFAGVCVCVCAGLHTGFFSGGGRGDLTDDLRMYMRRYHAYILVNTSHNNAVITNNFFLLVYVIILFVLYILHVYYYGILGGGGGGGGGRSQCAPPPPPPLCVPGYIYNYSYDTHAAPIINFCRISI